MATQEIRPEEVDIVIAATHKDLTFLEEWRPFLSQYHLVIVQDPNLNAELEVPSGFNHTLYTKVHMENLLGQGFLSNVPLQGHGCRAFGYLVSKKKYIISLDADCLPAKDPKGNVVNMVEQHLVNLQTPSTPTFFNTLYDPYREGCDFVRGYPFSLRQGVPSAISCGLWLNLPDYDSMTYAKKPEERNNVYVDAVLTVPNGAMFSMSGINLAFNREIIGPAMFSAFCSSGAATRHGTLEDVWCGLCCKVICDHLGYGIKTGLPYVWRKDPITTTAVVEGANSKEFKLLDEVFPFFQSLSIPRSALTVEDCFVEIGKQVKERLSNVDPFFAQVSSAMEAWIQAWKKSV